MAMIKGNDMDTHQTEAMIDAFYEAKRIWEQTPALHERRILQGNGGEALQVQQPGRGAAGHLRAHEQGVAVMLQR